MGKKVKLPENEVIALYKQDVLPKDIASRYGVSVKPVVDILDAHHVRKPVRFKLLPYATYEIVSNKQRFKEAISGCVTQKDIRDRVGINYDMAVSLCKEYGIATPGSSLARSIHNQRTAQYPFTKEAFEELYYCQGMAMDSISDGMGISIGHLRKTVRDQWHLPIRTPSNGKLSPAFRRVKDDPVALKQLTTQYTLSQLVELLSVNIGTLSNTIKHHGIVLPFRSRSAAEQEVVDLVSSHTSNVVLNDRQLIKPFELDIVLPDHKVAIEYCGLYWHSTATNKDHKYHVNKTNMCYKQGYQLITIFEDEWRDRRTQCENRILSVIGARTATPINGRDCVIVDVTPSQKATFLDAHHIQGNDVSAVCYGLEHDGQLIAVMTFAKPSHVRQSKSLVQQGGVWELNRYATDDRFVVRGGAGKLLSHFKKHHPWTRIFSYADRRWSVGRMYEALGFTLTKVSPPNYWYINHKMMNREYRYNYAKYKLVQQGFDPTLTEKQIMEHRGYHRIWDCGMLRYDITKD